MFLAFSNRFRFCLWILILLVWSSSMRATPLLPARSDVQYGYSLSSETRSPLLPIEKKNKKKTKKHRSNKHFKYHYQQLNVSEPDILSRPMTFVLLAGVFFVGLILFCIGFPLGIFWLWFIGAGFLWLHFGAFCLFALLAPLALKPRDEKSYILIWIMIAVGTLIGSFGIAGIAAIVMGLLMSLSWMWIAGIAAAVLSALLTLFMVGNIA